MSNIPSVFGTLNNLFTGSPTKSSNGDKLDRVQNYSPDSLHPKVPQQKAENMGGPSSGSSYLSNITTMFPENVKNFVVENGPKRIKEAVTSCISSQYSSTNSISEPPSMTKFSSPTTPPEQSQMMGRRVTTSEPSKKPTEDTKVTSSENSITSPDGAGHENTVVVSFGPNEMEAPKSETDTRTPANEANQKQIISNESPNSSKEKATERPKETDLDNKIQPTQHQAPPPNSLLFNAPFQKLGGPKKLDLTLPVGSTVILRVDKETARGLVAQTAGNVPFFSKSKTPLKLGNTTFQHDGSECYFLKLSVGEKGIAFKDITGEGDPESLNSMLGSSNLIVSVPQGADPSALKILFGSQPLKPVQGNEETEDDSKAKMVRDTTEKAAKAAIEEAEQAHNTKQAQQLDAEKAIQQNALQAKNNEGRGIALEISSLRSPT